VKHALLRIGAVALSSVVTAVALFALGRVILIGDLGLAMPANSQSSASPSPSPNPTSSPAVLSDIATPVPEPTATPEPSAAQTSAPSTAPLALTAFRFGGRSYVGIVVPDIDRMFFAPFAGRVEILVYQFIDGEVRVGSNVPSLPFYPYISVIAPDRKITYRSGTLGSDIEVLVRHGTTVAAGEPLFRLIRLGRSSWATFYNASAPYQVVVSLQAVPSGRDLDPMPYLGGS
jgi:hypothetical protein